MSRRNIILIGLSFTGKSTVGWLVARRLGWKFLDLDEEITRRTGKTIPEIFAHQGEKAFRSYESQALKEVLSEDENVIATGGGVIIAEENRRLMQASGLVVRLEATPETILKRLMKSQESSMPEERPLLSGEDPLSRIMAMKEQRGAFYEIAHIVIDTDELSAPQVVDRVVAAWQSYRADPPGVRDGPEVRGGTKPVQPAREAK